MRQGLRSRAMIELGRKGHQYQVLLDPELEVFRPVRHQKQKVVCWAS